MSALTVEGLRKMMLDVEKFAMPRQPSILDSLYARPSEFMGMKVYERPPPPPKIQVRDIKLADGTSILSPEFLAEQNAWWAARFGLQNDMWADKAFMVSGLGLVMHPKHMVMITNLGA